MSHHQDDIAAALSVHIAGIVSVAERTAIGHADPVRAQELLVALARPRLPATVEELCARGHEVLDAIRRDAAPLRRVG